MSARTPIAYRDLSRGEGCPIAAQRTLGDDVFAGRDGRFGRGRGATMPRVVLSGARKDDRRHLRVFVAAGRVGISSYRYSVTVDGANSSVGVRTRSVAGSAKTRSTVSRTTTLANRNL